MASHSSTLAWKIPWMEEPGRLKSKGSRKVRHDWGTSLSLFTFMHWRMKWQSTLVFLPGESGVEPGGLLSMGLHRVEQDWSDLAAAASFNIIIAIWKYKIKREYRKYQRINTNCQENKEYNRVHCCVLLIIDA